LSVGDLGQSSSLCLNDAQFPACRNLMSTLAIKRESRIPPEYMRVYED
jgi:hypothetical protein